MSAAGVENISVNETAANICDITAQDFKNAKTFVKAFAVLPTLHIILCTISGMVSSINMAVLTRRSMRSSSFNILLAALELANFLFAVSSLPSALMLEYIPAQVLLQLPGFITLAALVILMSATMNFTVFISVVIAAWRCVAVINPMKASVLLTRTRAAFILVFVAFFCIACSILTNCYSIRINVVSVFQCFDEKTTKGKMVKLFLPSKTVYYFWIYLAQDVMMFFLPTVFLVVVNVRIVRTLCERRGSSGQLREGQDCGEEEGQTRGTVILMCFVSAFVLTNASACSALLWDGWENEDDTRIPYFYRYIIDNYVLGILVNCFSFVGYYFMSTRFRVTVRDMLRK